jgi:hypothetical protein
VRKNILPPPGERIEVERIRKNIDFPEERVNTPIRKI